MIRKSESKALPLAREIAAELGEGWEADPPPEDDGGFYRDMHWVHDADGNQIMLELYDNDTRVEMRACQIRELNGHYHNSRDDWPSRVTVAVSRGAGAMARRCERDLIPTMRELNKKAREHKAESNRQSIADHAVAVELAGLLGVDRGVPLHERHGMQELLTEFEVSRYPYLVRVRHGSVRMELTGLAPDVALAVAKVLGDTKQ